MSSETVIRVANLGKRFRVPSRLKEAPGRKSLAHHLSTPARLFREIRGLTHFDGVDDETVFWALRGIDFEVKRGEVFGILGRNGAGKSTLLKILSRITAPTTGRVEIEGRVNSLLEVGTGFNPELTGRENIYMNGTLHGMSRREIDKKLDEIVDFSGVERFIDMPIKRYSSGMAVRLGFAVAAHLEPEILIIDEVLSVGDVHFQQKCIAKIHQSARSGKTVLFVSHNLASHNELSHTGLVLDGGTVRFCGGISAAISNYLYLEERQGASFSCLPPEGAPCGFVGGRVLNPAGSDVGPFDIQDPLVVEVDYRVHEPMRGLLLCLAVSRNMVEVFRSYNIDDGEVLVDHAPGLYRARYLVPARFLKAGTIHFGLDIGSINTTHHDLPRILTIDLSELSVDTAYKSFRQDRPGEVISPGRWEVQALP